MLRATALLLAAIAMGSTAAQSPLTALVSGGGSGNVGGGIYFDLTVNTTVTITRLDYYASPASLAGNSFADIYLGPTTYVGNTSTPSAWALAASTTPVPIPVPPAPMLVQGNLASPICLGPGTHGVALKANLHSWTYTNGSGNNPPLSCGAAPGSCLNSTFSTTELTLRAGAANNSFLVSGVFQPRVFNGAIHYTIGGTPIVMSRRQSYGQGCYGWYTSFYERFTTPAAVDLGNRAVRLASAGSSYTVSVLPAALFSHVAPTSLPLANEVPQNLATPFPVIYPDGNGGTQVANSLEISENGYISPAGPIASDPSATVAEFLALGPRWCPLWKEQIASGSLLYEIDPGGTAFYLTWQNVDGNTYQVKFFANGDVEWHYGSLNTVGAIPVIVGWTTGNGALDRGGVDLTGLPAGFSTQPSNNSPLALALSALPLLGTSPNWIINGYSPTTVVGAIVMSFTPHDPGLPLAAAGLPDCFQYVDLDSSSVFFTTGTTTTLPLVGGGIPMLPALGGLSVFCQAAAFTSGFNSLGVIVSNGVALRLGQY